MWTRCDTCSIGPVDRAFQGDACPRCEALALLREMTDRLVIACGLIDEELRHVDLATRRARMWRFENSRAHLMHQFAPALRAADALMRYTIPLDAVPRDP